ncbi:MAG: HAD family hydrolase [Balneolaceae bacterium]|nr:HAD family hydrolase [Balneolaceae bacterium]
MNKSPLSNIDGILLDMNSTFMFEEDNFDAQQDYYKTYLELNGKRLSKNSVNNIIRDCYNGMAILYKDSEYFENFPLVKDAFALFSKEAKDLPDEDLNVLTDVFAIHELGEIPEEYANFITALSKDFVLRLVANIWSPKNRWIEELQKSHIKDLFEVLVFSSDDSFMKPSPKIFQKALSGFSVKDPSRIAFIGDSLFYDIRGASGMGLKTIWIDKTAYQKSEFKGVADTIIPDLLYLKESYLPK